MSESPDVAGLLGELAGLEVAQARLAARRTRVLAAIHAGERAQRAAEAAADAAAGRRPFYEPAAERDRHWISEEVGLILRIAGISAQERVLQAHHLMTRLPASVALLEAARLHPAQAQRLSDAVIGLTDEQCADVEDRVLAAARVQPSLSITSFRRLLTRAVLIAAPTTAEQAHTDALTEQRVEVRPLEHGLTLLLAWLPAPDALRLKAAIWARAQNTGPAGTDGGQLADQRRAAALIDLIDLGATMDPATSPRPDAPAVQVTVSLTTLLGDSEEPGELAGYGPIPASMARLIAADPHSTWRRLVTDPIGRLKDYGRTTYRPPKDLDDFIRARDQICSFPNCHRRAVTCDVDHVHPWAEGGPTNQHNLVAACARHHHLKHNAAWTNHLDPTTGTVTWTSPTTGTTYTNPPPVLPGPSHPPATHPTPT